MNLENDSEKKNESKTNASLAGAGGGTLIAVIANQLPNSSVVRPILQYAAPSISILITALWVLIQVKIANHFRDKEVDFLFQKAREKLKRRISDPDISEEHRCFLQKQLEEIDSIDISRIKSKIAKLKVITSKDIVTTETLNPAYVVNDTNEEDS